MQVAPYVQWQDKIPSRAGATRQKRANRAVSAGSLEQTRLPVCTVGSNSCTCRLQNGTCACCIACQRPFSRIRTSRHFFRKTRTSRHCCAGSKRLRMGGKKNSHVSTSIQHLGIMELPQQMHEQRQDHSTEQSDKLRACLLGAQRDLACLKSWPLAGASTRRPNRTSYASNTMIFLHHLLSTLCEGKIENFSERRSKTIAVVIGFS